MAAPVAPDLFAVIASPRRREILRLVWDDEVSAGEIHRALPDVSFPAISLQLGALGRAGLVTVRRDGRHRYYRANRTRLGPVAELLQTFWNDALARLKLSAELDAARRGPKPGTR